MNIKIGILNVPKHCNNPFRNTLAKVCNLFCFVFLRGGGGAEFVDFIDVMVGDFVTLWRQVSGTVTAVLIYKTDYLSRSTTKPKNDLCALRRLRSAWASAERFMGSSGTKIPSCRQRMPRLIWVFAGRHRSICWLCHAQAYFSLAMTIFNTVIPILMHLMYMYLHSTCR